MVYALCLELSMFLEEATFSLLLLRISTIKAF